MYATIGDFGKPPGSDMDPTSNPLTYCMLDGLDSNFAHGSWLNDWKSIKCQQFSSDYCAANWDEACEVMSMRDDTRFPNQLSTQNRRMTAGDVLVYNTAYKKYATGLAGSSRVEYEPFDYTVADSPLVSRIVPSMNSFGQSTVIFDVDEKTIDTDPVMNKLLSKPTIAPDILAGIKATRQRTGRLHELAGTALGVALSAPAAPQMAQLNRK